MADQNPQETPQPDLPEPSRPGQPTETPSETPPTGPDVDVPSPAQPGSDPSPTPISPIGAGIVAPPD